MAKKKIESIEMIFVEGGIFTMGATPEQEKFAYDYEKPAHQVTLSSFSIGKYPVTQAQWKDVMGNNPSKFKNANSPVERVSWHDTKVFIGKLNEKTGKNYRLPTTAEWEFAARGGIKSMGFKYSGSNNADDVAWYENNSEEKTQPVGTKQPNELGIFDMSGNVWEWCEDVGYRYSSEAKTNPKGPRWFDSKQQAEEEGGVGIVERTVMERGIFRTYFVETYSGALKSDNVRVIRGGCWWHNANSGRVSCYNSSPPGSSGNDVGFRIACSSN